MERLATRYFFARMRIGAAGLLAGLGKDWSGRVIGEGEGGWG